LRLIIAASAFGLGVDYPCIRRITHWGAPNTPEELVQEAGRAGRDGSDAEAVLFDMGDQYHSKMNMLRTIQSAGGIFYFKIFCFKMFKIK